MKLLSVVVALVGSAALLVQAAPIPIPGGVHAETNCTYFGCPGGSGGPGFKREPAPEPVPEPIPEPEPVPAPQNGPTAECMMGCGGGGGGPRPF